MPLWELHLCWPLILMLLLEEWQKRNSIYVYVYVYRITDTVWDVVMFLFGPLGSFVDSGARQTPEGRISRSTGKVVLAQSLPLDDQHHHSNTSILTHQAVHHTLTFQKHSLPHHAPQIPLPASRMIAQTGRLRQPSIAQPQAA